MNINAMLSGCLSAILFAERDLNSAENDDTSLESHGWAVADFTDSTRAAIRAELAVFAWRNRRDLRAAFDRADYDETRAGMDYYFTTAEHGCGFWDRGLDEIGDRLTKACPRVEWCIYSTDTGELSRD